jgi:SAM-dependent methyltransferase
MSREQLEEHRRVWREKPALQDVYRVWFDLIRESIPAGGRVLEVGAGPGFLKAYVRERDPALRWSASDVLRAPWLDLAANGLRLPLSAGGTDAIVGLDVLHHFAHPQHFFTEAARVLRPGGRIVVVEPWVTAFSYPIYRFLHQEGCTPGLDPWNPFSLAPDAAKDAFDGDAAVVWSIVRSTPASQWRELGFAPPRIVVLNGFAYLASLGFKPGSLLPRPLVAPLQGLDRLLGGAARWLGLRALAVWDRESREEHASLDQPA